MFARLIQLFRHPTDNPSWLDPGELRRRIRRGDAPMIIDVREPDEFSGPLWHIDGAMNIPLAALAARADRVAQAGCPVVLVCLGDKRSAQAADALVAAGARDVAVLRGGMRAWSAV